MRVPQHVVDDRRRRLAELVQGGGWLPVAEVCEKLGVSEATARRDLAALEAGQEITRTRGGALCDFNQRFPSFRERQGVAIGAKRRIGKAAAALVEPGATLFLDAGSTIYAVAEALAGERAPRPLTVVTNSLPVADLLAEVEGISVNLLGGLYLRRLSVLLGPDVVRHLGAWELDLALLGAEGMDPDGLSNSQPDVVAVQAAAIKRARRHALCVDGGKLGHRAPEPLIGWSQVERLVTDATSARVRGAGIRFAPDRILTA